jgi:hypothetical protein
MAQEPDLTGRPDWDAIYRDRLFPRFAVRSGGLDHPRCVFVGGHQGSGKSTRLASLLPDFGADVTQRIVADELVASIDELRGVSSKSRAALSDYCRIHSSVHCDRLAEHAIARRSHIIWERAVPGDIDGIALALRSLGYEVDCLVLATPVEESWLGTLHRSLSSFGLEDPTAMHVGWPLLCETALRWPAVLDRLEHDLAVDTVTVVDRDGDICFENRIQGAADARRWADPPFAFESLMVERARPRTEAALSALLADWEKLHPLIAATDHATWPPADLRAFDAHLRALATDPASRFDLNQPDPDPTAARAWIARLGADLAAVQAGPEAKGPGFTARCDRLLQLVSQVAGQPTR